MKTEMGEYIVGAYLKIIKECDFIDYNIRPPGGGIEGLDELDVLGLDFRNKRAYLCEVATHIRGILYKNNKITVERIKKKYNKQKVYAKKYLKEDFHDIQYMFWSPVVPKGFITNELAKMRGLQVLINGDYAACVDEIREKAKQETFDIGNPFFRMLQILEHMRRS